jgi:hypothetical protein
MNDNHDDEDDVDDDSDEHYEAQRVYGNCRRQYIYCEIENF